MRERLTNVGKKEQRQVEALINKEAKGQRVSGGREAESRTVRKQTRGGGRTAK